MKAFVITLMVASTLAACGGDGDDVAVCTDPDTGDVVECTAPTAVPTVEPTVEPTTVPTPEPTPTP